MNKEFATMPALRPFRLQIIFCLFGVLWAAYPTWAEPSLSVPVLDGKWWQIAPNAPDVGDLKTGGENACDFALFPDKNGDWHCISCIRGTKAPGQRILFQWTSPKITDENWKPVGFLEVERGTVGRPPMPVAVQAPDPVIWKDKWYLFYNSNGARCMISDDGINWQQHTDANSQTKFFDMGRDVCVVRDEARQRWIAYYAGTVKSKGAMVARTAPALGGPWSKEEITIRAEGNPESPFVILHDGKWYLWQQMAVYVSNDPLDFNKAPMVTHMTGLWYDGYFAPEIAQDGQQWYIAGYNRGIYVAKFKWEQKPLSEIAAWREKFQAYLKDSEVQRLAREAKRLKEAVTRPVATQP